MPFEQKYVNYGVIKIDNERLRIYKDKSDYMTLPIPGQKIMNAIWSGGAIVVTLADGKIRRYRDPSNYSTI